MKTRLINSFCLSLSILVFGLAQEARSCQIYGHRGYVGCVSSAGEVSGINGVYVGRVNLSGNVYGINGKYAGYVNSSNEVSGINGVFVAHIYASGDFSIGGRGNNCSTHQLAAGLLLLLSH